MWTRGGGTGGMVSYESLEVIAAGNSAGGPLGPQRCTVPQLGQRQVLQCVALICSRIFCRDFKATEAAVACRYWVGCLVFSMANCSNLGQAFALTYSIFRSFRKSRAVGNFPNSPPFFR